MLVIDIKRGKEITMLRPANKSDHIYEASQHR